MRICLCCLGLFASSSGVFAHPGGLDSQGGHNDRKNGTYHFHRPVNSPSPGNTATQAERQASSTTPKASKSLAIEVSGKVVGITDGDTVTILIMGNKQLKVRLDGIDAPESKQAFGSKSKQYLSDLVFEKNVRIRITETDRYGRKIGRILLNDEDINLKMVNDGMAWWYREFASNDSKLQEAEKSAKERKVGLWGDTTPLPPWEFRRQPKS